MCAINSTSIPSDATFAPLEQTKLAMSHLDHCFASVLAVLLTRHLDKRRVHHSAVHNKHRSEMVVLFSAFSIQAIDARTHALPVEKQVTDQARIFVGFVRSQQQIRIQSEHSRDSCGCAAMVALNASTSDNAIRIPVHRFRHQELQFADLVAGRLHPTEVLYNHGKEKQGSTSKRVSIGSPCLAVVDVSGCASHPTSRLMYILTPSGKPGGANGKIGVGKWPSLSFFAGGLRREDAHFGATNGTLLSISLSFSCFFVFEVVLQTSHSTFHQTQILGSDSRLGSARLKLLLRRVLLKSQKARWRMQAATRSQRSADCVYVVALGRGSG